MGGCTANSDMDMDTTCSKKTDSAKDTCPSDTHHCHPDHAKAIQSGANKGCTANSDMDMDSKIPTASAVVVAKLEVTGVKESALVNDKNMQAGLIKGFAKATGVSRSATSITQIGNTKLNSVALGSLYE